MSEKLVFWVSLANRARAEEKNHGGTGEGVRPLPPCPLCLCGSNVLTKTWFC